MMDTLELVEISQDFIEVEIPTDDVILIDPTNWCIPQVNTSCTEENTTFDVCPNAEIDERENVESNSSPKDSNQTKISTKNNTKNIKITKLSALYFCKICKYNTLQRDVMSEHLQTHRTKSKGVVVPNFRRTKQGQDKEEYVPCPRCTHKCPNCSFFSRNMQSLKVHKRIHLNKNPYKCVDCEYRAKDLKELAKHYGDTHSKKSIFVCDICGFKTYTKNKFEQHKRSHKEEQC